MNVVDMVLAGSIPHDNVGIRGRTLRSGHTEQLNLLAYACVHANCLDEHNPRRESEVLSYVSSLTKAMSGITSYEMDSGISLITRSRAAWLVISNNLGESTPRDLVRAIKQHKASVSNAFTRAMQCTR